MPHTPNTSTSERPRLSWEELDRYLAGECTPDERAAAHRAFAHAPLTDAFASALVARLRAERARGATFRPFDTEARWERMRVTLVAEQGDTRAAISSSRMERMMRAPHERTRGPFGVMRRPVRALLAVGLALIAVVAGLTWSRTRDAMPSKPIATYVTRAAERTTLRLPDGTQVILAPASRLTFSATRAGDRRITLDGQASFDVAHDDAHSFVVQTGAIETRVLGTAFSVRRYDTDSVVEVAVQSGKVATGARGTSAVLTPGMIGRVTDSSVTTRPTGGLDAAAWTRGTLVFERVSVPAMLETVGRWYGYTFVVADSALRAQHVSVTLRADRPEETMSMLKSMLHVTMTFRGSVVTLSPKADAPAGRRAIKTLLDSSFITPTQVGK